MTVALSTAWRLGLAAVLVAAVVASARARAPGRAVPGGDLHRLVVCAVTLYAVGAAAWATGHLSLATAVFAAGIAIAALTAWLSRGQDSPGSWDGGGPGDEQPPPGPSLDWPAFERDLSAYAERRSPARSSAYAERRSPADSIASGRS